MGFAAIRKTLLILPLLVGLQLVRYQVHFDCPQLPPLSQPAKTVHELRPQDIKVVMALGDSITAGTCM
jgi:phospholipase B1